MSSNLKSLAVAIIGVFMPFTASAVPLNFNLPGNTIGTTVFGGNPGWESGDVLLPGGTVIGSTPLEIVITLDQNLTILAAGDLAFGMGGFDPLTPNGEIAFSFQISLSLDGTIITTAYGFDLYNPFGDTDNLGVSFGPQLDLVGVEFNDIHITITSPVEREVTHFNVGVRLDTTPSPVPDASSTLLLLPLGLLALAGVRRTMA